MSAGPHACLICPPLRRTLCLVPCSPEIAAALAKTDADVEAVEVLHFAPPARSAPDVYITAAASRIHRARTDIHNLR